jgi:hypothetical protein
MTQPAVHGRPSREQDLEQNQEQGHDPQQNQQGPRPEAVPGPAGTGRRRSAPWRRAALIAAAGVPAGPLWWLLAPSGLNLLSGKAALQSGSSTDTWLPRDLVLAGLFLLAGCITGVLCSGSKRGEASVGDVVLAVLAGGAGAVIAWRTGVLCGAWWGPVQDTSANASIAFSLRSYAALAIWPAAVALSMFLAALFAAPNKAPNGWATEAGTAPHAPSA